MEAMQAMIMRVTAVLWLALLGVPLASPDVGAASLQTLETFPAANAVIDTRSDGFFVRFDKPIDHVRSLLLIKRGNQVVETLYPRLEAAPEVLFARAPTLPPGNYTLHWLVRTLADADVIEGEISFRITAASPRRTDFGSLLRLASTLPGDRSISITDISDHPGDASSRRSRWWCIRCSPAARPA
jgi:methionine-rich copper-binding protein CopC